MDITIITPNGIEYEEKNCTYILVSDKFVGAFGMLNEHLPVISTISRGYIAITKENKETDYLAISGAILRNKNDIISVTCESAVYGKTKEEALSAFENLLEIRREQNRERNVELALAENQLKKEIKKSGAGHI